MTSYSIPAEFVRHQVVILGLLRDAKPLLAGKDHAVRPTLRLYRARLSRLLRDYQTFKHEELYDPAIAGGTAEAALAADLKADCVALAAEYSAHAVRHAAVDMEEQWSGYRLAALSMIRRLETSIIREGEIARGLGAMASTHGPGGSPGD